MNSTTAIEAPYQMERLNFKLREFTRVSWTSDEARELWEPRIARVVRAWEAVERQAVLDGLRPCALQAIEQQHFDALASNLAAHGITIRQLDKVGPADAYLSVQSGDRVGANFRWWSVMGTEADTAAFETAYRAGDHSNMGALLGYPDCCRAFFNEAWHEHGFMDSSWPMAFNTSGARHINERTIELPEQPFTNTLLRWIGPRIPSHLPCSASCEETIALGKIQLEIWQRIGFAEEASWLLEMLCWPLEWTALHGIGEVRTPVLKLAFSTDPTPQKYTIRYMGTAMPEGAATGLQFPYKSPTKKKLTERKAFKSGLENPIEEKQVPASLSIATPAPPAAPPSWHYTDNGFASPEAMQQAHAQVIDFLQNNLTGLAGPVLDLGCGNGALLQQLCARFPQAVPLGVDADANRIAHAQQLMPGYAHLFRAGDLYESPSLFHDVQAIGLALLMPGRIAEDPVRGQALLRWLASLNSHVLAYVYPGYLAKGDTVEAVMERAGLRFANPDASNIGWALLRSESDQK